MSQLLGRLADIALTLESADLPGANDVRAAAVELESAATHTELAQKLRTIIERIHKSVGDRVFDLRQEAEALVPFRPVGTVLLPEPFRADKEAVDLALAGVSALRSSDGSHQPV